MVVSWSRYCAYAGHTLLWENFVAGSEQDAARTLERIKQRTLELSRETMRIIHLWRRDMNFNPDYDTYIGFAYAGEWFPEP